jgi:hypothetical protein
LEAVHRYSDNSEAHVHNVYAFEISGKREVFAAIMGNPWVTPRVPGYGLAHLDVSAGRFDSSYTTERLSVRSAVQQSDGVVYVVTQEAAGVTTKLARLEPHGNKFRVVAKTGMESRTTGDGGADVVLGRERDTVFVSDRGAGPNGKGMIYFYKYGIGYHNFGFIGYAAHETGKNPRYTTMLSNGDVVSCNQDDGTIKAFVCLGLDPTADWVNENTFPAMGGVLFILETEVPTPPPTPPPTPQQTPQPTPRPTPQPAPQPTTCKGTCKDAALTPWGWSCQNLKDQGYCTNKEVQGECPHSCDACHVDDCKDAEGTSTPWRLSCAWLAANGYCANEDVKRECPDSCGQCR